MEAKFQLKFCLQLFLFAGLIFLRSVTCSESPTVVCASDAENCKATTTATMTKSIWGDGETDRVVYDRKQEVDDLLGWFRYNGGYLHPNLTVGHLRPTIMSDVQRGWKAIGNISAAETIISIPQKLWLCDEFSSDSPHLENKTLTQMRQFYLLKKILLEKDKGKKSFWFAYFATLPTAQELSTRLPIMYSNEDVHIMDHSSLALGASLKRTRESLTWMSGACENDSDVRSLCSNLNYGLGIILSRHFTQLDHQCLMPVLDFANHYTSAPMLKVHNTHPVLIHCTVETDKPFVLGDQIFITYNHMSIVERFVKYGFTGTSPADYLILPLSQLEEMDQMARFAAARECSEEELFTHLMEYQATQISSDQRFRGNEMEDSARLSQYGCVGKESKMRAQIARKAGCFDNTSPEDHHPLPVHTDSELLVQRVTGYLRRANVGYWISFLGGYDATWLHCVRIGHLSPEEVEKFYYFPTIHEPQPLSASNEMVATYSTAILIQGLIETSKSPSGSEFTNVKLYGSEKKQTRNVAKFRKTYLQILENLAFRLKGQRAMLISLNWDIRYPEPPAPTMVTDISSTKKRRRKVRKVKRRKNRPVIDSSTDDNPPSNSPTTNADHAASDINDHTATRLLGQEEEMKGI